MKKFIFFLLFYFILQSTQDFSFFFYFFPFDFFPLFFFLIYFSKEPIPRASTAPRRLMQTLPTAYVQDLTTNHIDENRSILLNSQAFPGGKIAVKAPSSASRLGGGLTIAGSSVVSEAEGMHNFFLVLEKKNSIFSFFFLFILFILGLEIYYATNCRSHSLILYLTSLFFL